jgi:hypothetical protein
LRIFPLISYHLKGSLRRLLVAGLLVQDGWDHHIESLLLIDEVCRWMIGREYQQFSIVVQAASKVASVAEQLAPKRLSSWTIPALEVSEGAPPNMSDDSICTIGSA